MGDPCEVGTLLPPKVGRPERLCLTIAYHPDLSRIGESFVANDGRLELSRTAPAFGGVGQADPKRPLDDPYISRRPTVLRVDGLRVSSDDAGQAAVLGGAKSDALSIDASSPVVLNLANRVLLVAHARRPRTTTEGQAIALEGVSDVIEDVRRSAARAAQLGSDVCILVRGPTGSGKDRLAREIHRAAGSDRPFVPINTASLVPRTAAATLFGDQASGTEGLIARAGNGTVFLDGIEDCPDAVQAVLMRAVEQRTYHAVGSAIERQIEARFIASTSISLSDAAREGRFRAGLLHRLTGFVIALPSIKERTEDICVLVRSALAEALEDHDRLDRLKVDPPWFGQTLMARILASEWPGNVRQLRNVVGQLVAVGIDEPTLRATATISSRLADVPTAVTVGDETELLRDALRANGWAPGPTAESLGIPRSTLYDRMARAGIRAARDVSDEELLETHREHGGDIDATSATLRVSRRAVQMRLRSLGVV